MFNLFGKSKIINLRLTTPGLLVIVIWLIFLAAGSVSTKDLIAPSYVEVDFNSLKIDDRFYRTLYVVGYPRYVSPNWLYSLITFDHPLYISMYIYPTESKNILDDLKRKIAEMEATIEGDIKAGKVVDPTVQVALDDAFSFRLN